MKKSFLYIIIGFLIGVILLVWLQSSTVTPGTTSEKVIVKYKDIAVPGVILKIDNVIFNDDIDTIKINDDIIEVDLQYEWNVEYNNQVIQDSISFDFHIGVTNMLFHTTSDSIVTYTKFDDIKISNLEVKYTPEQYESKWYNNRYLWFVYGVLVTSSSVYLAGQLSN